ncbi:MAG: hypothetical protein OXF41_07375, partial [bacterium]|nr:hypothetical protein [bacterium]
MPGVPGRLYEPGGAGVYRDTGWRALLGVVRVLDLGDRVGSPSASERGSRVCGGSVAADQGRRVGVRRRWCDGEGGGFFGNLVIQGRPETWRRGVRGDGVVGTAGGRV